MISHASFDVRQARTSALGRAAATRVFANEREVASLVVAVREAIAADFRLVPA
jgi:hypothetical protein